MNPARNQIIKIGVAVLNLNKNRLKAVDAVYKYSHIGFQYAMLFHFILVFKNSV